MTGEIDLSNANEVRLAIGDALTDAATVVVVDLSGTTYLDSAGIAMFFMLAERLTFNRQELRLLVPEDSPIRRVISMTQLDRVAAVQESAD